MKRVAVLAALVTCLIGCGSDSACPSGQVLISVLAPNSDNPVARKNECWPSSKPLPDGAARVE